MLSIPSTLSFHRATRALYMNAARRAALDAASYDDCAKMSYQQTRWKIHVYYVERWNWHVQALRCFLHRARLANWKLIAVKRFAREFEVGRGNLLKLGDDSVWRDL